MIYPWSAVVAQDTLKQALLLCAIDPTIGGVLVQGQRGVAKTTLARALGELLQSSFVELPLGASEERVTGSLDLNAALQQARVQFSPGLLARAHEGVLYVDEVNLLPDPLVDLLLDAAATGQNSVERDGVSHTHAARFVLIGTMNPEEGELRPQLTDRFGLSVVADSQIAPAQRAEIVARRLLFEADRAGFLAQYATAQGQLIERVRAARARATDIPLGGLALAYVAELCYAAGVEGVRADLAMLRAARAHAAWQQHSQIQLSDVDAVSELALAHRRKPQNEPPPPRSSGDAGSSQAGSGGAGANQAGRTSDGSRGAMQAVPVPASAPPRLPSWLTRPGTTLRASEPRRRGSPRVGASRGTRGPRYQPHGSIDWFATLCQWRTRMPGAARPLRADLRYRVRRTPHRQLWVLALDCSSSMLRGGGLSAAKGLAHALQAHAHRAGAHVALISFRGSEARLVMGPGSARETLVRGISALPAGGGTPLRHALQQALAICEQRAFRAPSVSKRIVLATDARTREQLAGLCRPRSDLSLVVVDCERGPLRLARAPALAATLGARCVHIDAL